MGKRLYVAKRYILEYADHSDFNWKIEEFHNVLDTLGVSQCNIEPDEVNGISYSCEFEVDKQEMVEALNQLQAFLDGAPLPESIDEDDLHDNMRALFDDGMDLNAHVKYFIDSMSKFIEQADPDCDYLRFSFF